MPYSEFTAPVFRGSWTQQQQIQHKESDPGGGVGEQDFDWEADDNPYKKRFEDYRSEADRRATEYQQTQALLADLQSDDPEQQRAAAQRLGFDFVGDESDEETEPAGPDPRIDALAAKYEALEQKLSAKETADEQARVANLIDSRVNALGLDEDEGTLVLATAIKMGAVTDDGLPDVSKAHAFIQQRDAAREQAAIEAYRAGKRVTIPGGKGKSGTENKAVEDMTAEERLDYALEKNGML